MFLLDDILMSPMRGLYSVFRELHEAARQEMLNEGENIRQQLSELYMRLETGQLDEQEFDNQERVLLDRLDELEAAREQAAAEEEDEELMEEGEDEEVEEDEAEEDEEDEDEVMEEDDEEVMEEDEVEFDGADEEEPVGAGGPR